MENKYPHTWEKVKMADGKIVKRCAVCFYSYEFGHDLSCPQKIKEEKENEN